MTLSEYSQHFIDYLNHNIKVKQPTNLYTPIEYILQLGGKRVRPVLTLIAAEAAGITAQEALPAAMAVEVFHNFTLLHDDIMDQAPVRRGKPTVHTNWNVNTAILSGDAMMIKSYEYLNVYPSTIFKPLTQTLTQVALEVCEGQQYDMDFEVQKNVTITDYMLMIKLKTAVLLGAALKMGAIVGKASQDFQDKIYQFGVFTGIAFQLQDDYLDTFGSIESFGKKIGGDIDENKKTWLYLKTLELADDNDKEELIHLYQQTANDDSKYEKVKTIFEKYNIPQRLQSEIELYNNKASQLLDEIAMPYAPQQALKSLLKQLQHRES